VGILREPCLYFKLLPSVKAFERCVDGWPSHLDEQLTHRLKHAYDNMKDALSWDIMFFNIMHILLSSRQLLVFSQEVLCT